MFEFKIMSVGSLTSRCLKLILYAIWQIFESPHVGLAEKIILVILFYFPLSIENEKCIFPSYFVANLVSLNFSKHKLSCSSPRLVKILCSAASNQHPYTIPCASPPVRLHVLVCTTLLSSLLSANKMHDYFLSKYLIVWNSHNYIGWNSLSQHPLPRDFFHSHQLKTGQQGLNVTMLWLLKYTIVWLGKICLDALLLS